MEGTPAAISDRIRKFRQSCPGCSTQQAFAAALGVDQQRLSGYENGTKVPHYVIAGLIRMGASPYWLLFGEGSMRGGTGNDEDIRQRPIKVVNVSNATITDRQMAEFHVLPLYSDEVAAGEPREMRDTEIEGPAVLHRAWCPHPGETVYVRVHSTGTSMEPTIPAGAIVTIDGSERDPERLMEKIVALRLRDGGVTLKRLRRTQRGGYVGVPDNPTDENRTIPLEDGDEVIGLVQTVHARVG